VINWLLEWVGIPFLVIGVWACGSAFMSKYIERDQHEKGRTSYDWYDDVWGILLVGAWPVSVPLSAPFMFALKAGGKVYNRLHRADLVINELEGKNNTAPNGPNQAYVTFVGAGFGQVHSIAIPIRQGYGHTNLQTPVEVQGIQVSIT
jgi:hypothetical protein